MSSGSAQTSIKSRGSHSRLWNVEACQIFRCTTALSRTFWALCGHFQSGWRQRVTGWFCIYLVFIPRDVQDRRSKRTQDTCVRLERRTKGINTKYMYTKYMRDVMYAWTGNFYSTASLISFRFLRERCYVFHCEAPEIVLRTTKLPPRADNDRVSTFVVELFPF